eukprot:gene681-842_t
MAEKCHVCKSAFEDGSTQSSIKCSDCNQSFHINCLPSPPPSLNGKVQKGWQCQECSVQSPSSSPSSSKKDRRKTTRRRLICSKCNTGKDEDKILLCDTDGCSRGYHMYCLRYPISAVPKGDWICDYCRFGEISQETHSTGEDDEDGEVKPSTSSTSTTTNQSQSQNQSPPQKQNVNQSTSSSTPSSPQLPKNLNPLKKKEPSIKKTTIPDQIVKKQSTTTSSPPSPVLNKSGSLNGISPSNNGGSPLHPGKVTATKPPPNSPLNKSTTLKPPSIAKHLHNNGSTTSLRDSSGTIKSVDLIPPPKKLSTSTAGLNNSSSGMSTTNNSTANGNVLKRPQVYHDTTKTIKKPSIANGNNRLQQQQQQQLQNKQRDDSTGNENYTQNQLPTPTSNSNFTISWDLSTFSPSSSPQQQQQQQQPNPTMLTNIKREPTSPPPLSLNNSLPPQPPNNHKRSFTTMVNDNGHKIQSTFNGTSSKVVDAISVWRGKFSFDDSFVCLTNLVKLNQVEMKLEITNNIVFNKAFFKDLPTSIKEQYQSSCINLNNTENPILLLRPDTENNSSFFNLLLKLKKNELVGLGLTWLEQCIQQKQLFLPQIPIQEIPTYIPQQHLVLFNNNNSTILMDNNMVIENELIFSQLIPLLSRLRSIGKQWTVKISKTVIEELKQFSQTNFNIKKKLVDIQNSLPYIEQIDFSPNPPKCSTDFLSTAIKLSLSQMNRYRHVLLFTSNRIINLESKKYPYINCFDLNDGLEFLQSQFNQDQQLPPSIILQQSPPPPQQQQVSFLPQQQQPPPVYQSGITNRYSPIVQPSLLK